MSQELQTPPKKYRLRHGRMYLVEKSWDSYDGEMKPQYQYVEGDVIVGGNIVRSAVIIYAANARDMADTYCINGNKACAKCPERTKLRMRYKVIERSVPAEYRFESNE